MRKDMYKCVKLTLGGQNLCNDNGDMLGWSEET